MPVLRIPGRLGLLAVAVSLLAACSQDEGAAQQTPATSGPHLVSAPPPADALPDCTRIASAVGDLVTGLTAVDDAGARQESNDGYGLSCAWRDANDGAALGVIILVDHQPLTAADMQRAGLYAEDPRVSALGGFVAIPDGLLDGKAPLGPIGPQVIVGPVTVTVAGNGRGRAETVTLDQAVDGAIAVHRLMR